jgi:hypothetical protein
MEDLVVAVRMEDLVVAVGMEDLVVTIMVVVIKVNGYRTYVPMLPRLKHFLLKLNN